MHHPEYVVIEYNHNSSGRKRVSCCACELDAVVKEEFAVPEDLLLVYTGDDGTTIDTDGCTAQLRRGQIVYASLWSAPRPFPVVLVSESNPSERFLGSVSSRTYEALESLAKNIFIADTVYLSLESVGRIHADDELPTQDEHLEVYVATSGSSHELVPQRLRVRIDARWEQLLSPSGVLLQRPCDTLQFKIESAESISQLLSKLKRLCTAGEHEQFKLFMLNQSQALHTVDRADLSTLPVLDVLSSGAGVQTVLPWASTFRIITCKVPCQNLIALTAEERHKRQFQVILNTKRCTGLKQLANEIRRQLAVSPDTQIAFKGVQSFALLPDTVELYLESTVMVVNTATDDWVPVTLESEWTAEILAEHLRTRFSIPKHKRINLFLQPANGRPKRPLDGVQILDQLSPSDQIVMEYCCVDCKSCLSDRIARGEVVADVWRNVTLDAWTDACSLSLRKLSCGHTICVQDILYAASRTTPFSEDEIKRIPSVAPVVPSVAQVGRAVRENRSAQASHIRASAATSTSGAFSLLLNFWEGAYTQRSTQQSSGESKQETKRDADDTPADHVLDIDDLRHILRSLIRLGDKDGALLSSLEFKDLACPVAGCHGTVPHESLTKIPVFVEAEERALQDQQAWQRAQPCSLSPLLLCEPSPVESMIALGDCSHFFHLDCLATAVRSELNSKQFHTLVCPGCEQLGSAASCTCPFCAQAERNGPHKITEEELKYLVNTGHLTTQQLERWSNCENKLAATNLAEADGHVIVHCRNCPHMFFGNPDWPRYRCRECNFAMCTACMEEEHATESCEEAKDRTTREQHVKHFEELNLPYQFCPQCHTLGGLPLACYHVDCPQCLIHHQGRALQLEFCFVCGCYRSPSVAHNDASFHRPSCRFYTTCCNKNCVINGAAGYLPNECHRCREAGAMCERPQDPADGELCVIHNYEALEKRQAELRTEDRPHPR